MDVDSVALLGLSCALDVSSDIDNKAGLLGCGGSDDGGGRGQDSEGDELHFDVCVVCL